MPKQVAKVLTDAMIRRIKPATARIEVPDLQQPGLRLIVQPSGAKSWAVRYRLDGKPGKFTIGEYPTYSLAEARKLGEHARKLAAQGVSPMGDKRRQQDESRTAKSAADARRIETVVESFLARHAAQNRTAAETRRIFERYMLPAWRGRHIEEISRRDVAVLLDRIEDGACDSGDGRTLGGPVMADRTLAAIRKLMNWYAARDDAFVSPVVRGMGRTKPKDRARDRVLSDAELRALWPLLDRNGTFGAIVKTLFLTAQRRDEVASMRRSEIADDVWTIPAERYKTGRSNVVPLTAETLAIVGSRPVINGGDFVFTTTGWRPFSGFSKAKRALDTDLAEALGGPVRQWQLHDIRRTTRTLMTRAGVRPDIAERVLGHVIAGVEGVYDRHGYEPEKRAALEALWAEIERTVNPPAGNVVAMTTRR